MSRPHLLDALRDQVLLCDGGMGSRAQSLPLDIEKDYWGRENCTDVLVLSRPDLVRDIHRGFFEAGADMVETNTFGASPVTLGEFDLSERAFEINKIAGELPSQDAQPSSPPAHRPTPSPPAATAGCSAASGQAPSYPASEPSRTTRWRPRSPYNAVA